MTPKDHVHARTPPRTALMAGALGWATALGWLSTRNDDLRPLLFHMAMWVPLLLLLAPLARRGTGASWRLMGLGVALFGLADVAWDLRATGPLPRSCRSTSTASSRRTTATATRPATSCWRPWRTASAAAPETATR